MGLATGGQILLTRAAFDSARQYVHAHPAAGEGVAGVRVEAWDKDLICDDLVGSALTNAQGELFGFERTQQVSNEPARYIAQTAKRFGQNDDITVISIYLASRDAKHKQTAIPAYN